MAQQFTLRLILEDPYGKQWSAVLPIDAFEAQDRYVNLSPPNELDRFVGTATFDSVMTRIQKREYRKEDFRNAAQQLATKLGERMEDEEGWHGISRQETYEKLRKEGRA